MNALEFKSKHGNVVFILNLIGSDRMIVVQSEEFDGFGESFDFIHDITISDLNSIIRNPNRSEKDQSIIDELNRIALSFLKE